MSAEKNYAVTKQMRQRLMDLRDADVPMWKIAQIVNLSEPFIRKKYPDVFQKPKESGPKQWDPTPEQLRQIEIMAGMGISNKRIALVVGISTATLEAVCSQIISRSSVLMDMRVGANIYKMATGDPKEKNTALMAQFWAKTRMKWQEVQRIESTGVDGGPIQTQVQIYLPSNGRDEIEDTMANDSDYTTIDAESDGRSYDEDGSVE